MNFTETGGRKLSELYPDVTRILLFVAFEEVDSEDEPNFLQLIFTPDSEVEFRLGCSRNGCVDGGFDYAPYIAELIKSGEGRAHGKIVCKGELGSGEGLKPCSLQSEYRIIIQ